MNEVNFAFIAGIAFLNSISHCVGMCGGFVSMQSIFLKGSNPLSSFVLSLFYHVARITSYAFLGGLFAVFGGLFAISAQSQALFFFIMGSLMVLIGFALLRRGVFLKFLESRWLSKITTKAGLFFIRRGDRMSFVLLGFLNGFVPCGVVYYFLAYAMLSSSVYEGVLIMLVFGICTLPAMLFLVNLFTFLQRWKNMIYQISCLLIMANGIYLGFLGYMAYGRYTN